MQYLLLIYSNEAEMAGRDSSAMADRRFPTTRTTLPSATIGCTSYSPAARGARKISARPDRQPRGVQFEALARGGIACVQGHADERRAAEQ
jgi:hypothetical protein